MYERITPTKDAYNKCAQWLKFCLDIGWDKSHLNTLEKLWWEHHDMRGNLIKRQPIAK